jgi:hypothetical protein
MRQILKRFGGRVPRIENPRKLPAYSATRAQDVDMTSGSLVPLAFDAPFQSLHNTDGTLKSGLDWGDVISIDAPAQVTLDSKIFQCLAFNWMDIYCDVFMTWVDSGGVFRSQNLTGANPSTSSWTLFADELVVSHKFTSVWASNLDAGTSYQIRGPIYRFVTFPDTDYDGGPNPVGFIYPAEVTWASSQVSPFVIPLTYPISMSGYDAGDGTGLERYVYAQLELIDYDIPTPVRVVEPDVDVAQYDVLDAHIATFRFKLNYVRGGQQFAYYLQSHTDLAIAYGEYSPLSTTAVVKLKQTLSTTTSLPSTGILRYEDGTVIGSYTAYNFDTINNVHEFTMASAVSLYTEDDLIEIIDTSLDGDAGREGPPSEVSQIISVDPGVIPRLQTELASDGTKKTRLYRSSSAEEGSFRLLSDDASSDTGAKYFDTFLDPLGEALPPYGNYPHASKAAALEGSVLHPASWGATFFGNLLYPSDVFRTWAFPEEYTIAFDSNIRALAITGNSIIVFTEGRDFAGVTEQGKVYEISGNNPEYLAAYELSNSHPLLNKVGLAKIGPRIYWPTIDGLAMTAGGEVQLMSEMFFTRKQWLDEKPEFMSAYTGEDSVWFITTGARNWRFDFDEVNKEPFTYLSTFTDFSGNELVYQTKPFQFDRPMRYSHIRVEAEDYPVGISFLDVNDQIRCDILITDSKVRRLPAMRREREWQFRINSLSTVIEVGLATSSKELGDGR